MKYQNYIEDPLPHPKRAKPLMKQDHRSSSSSSAQLSLKMYADFTAVSSQGPNRAYLHHIHFYVVNLGDLSLWSN